MKRANISFTKNNLSKLIDEVRKGEVIVIVDRDVPVAQLQPINNFEHLSGRLPSLEREGAVSIPAHQLDAQELLAREKIKLKNGISAADAVIADRAEGR